jgi:predicted dehydrogenase
MDFAECCKSGRAPVSSGRDGYRALQTVLAIYESCRSGQPVSIAATDR